MKITSKNKAGRVSLDEARKKYIEGIVAMLKKEKFDSYVVNILQSFVYLILNDDFHDEILKIRKSLGIPQYGFVDDADYEKWSSDDSSKALTQKTEQFIDKYDIAYERHRPLVIEFIRNYILLKFFSVKSLKTKSWSYNRFVGGFDVPDPIKGENNTIDFDKIWWEVYFQPTDNITQFKRSLKRHFVWMMKFHFKEFHESVLFEKFNQDILKTTNLRIKKPVELEIIQHENKMTLKFVSYLNTRTKDVERIIEKNQNKLEAFQKKLKLSQQDNRAESTLFATKLNHYFLYLEGCSAPDIENMLYLNGKRQFSSYSAKSDYIRTHIKEVKGKVLISFGRKLSL